MSYLYPSISSTSIHRNVRPNGTCFYHVKSAKTFIAVKTTTTTAPLNSVWIQQQFENYVWHNDILSAKKKKNNKKPKQMDRISFFRRRRCGQQLAAVKAAMAIATIAVECVKLLTLHNFPKNIENSTTYFKLFCVHYKLSIEQRNILLSININSLNLSISNQKLAIKCVCVSSFVFSFLFYYCEK